MKEVVESGFISVGLRRVKGEQRTPRRLAVLIHRCCRDALVVGRADASLELRPIRVDAPMFNDGRDPNSELDAASALAVLLDVAPAPVDEFADRVQPAPATTQIGEIPCAYLMLSFPPLFQVSRCYSCRLDWCSLPVAI
jgi:hypothetical protein